MMDELEEEAAHLEEEEAGDRNVMLRRVMINQADGMAVLKQPPNFLGEGQRQFVGRLFKTEAIILIQGNNLSLSRTAM